MKTVDKFLSIEPILSMSVPNLMIRHPDWANIACFRLRGAHLIP